MVIVFLVKLVALVLLCSGCPCFVSFPHVSKDDQRSLILARSWPHPPFDSISLCKFQKENLLG